MADRTVAPKVLVGRVLGSTRSTFLIHENTADLGPDSTSPRGIPLHLHRTEDEAWYVLEGALRFQFGRRRFDARPGEGVLLPHGVPHTFWNPGPLTARYLLVVGPRTEGLLRALHRPGRPRSARELRALYERFDCKLVG